ncbi:hypothetical protein DPMN_034968 [Dreissena polymorpha]|uniref:C3H1-type domain-containing protein n=1 Tax=Dreissena polymorpha TaxID=45954 RepID=A0A9D4RMJ1_DREPO|nr:hypothetical protein DPMN_034968 [Dreissena polymorpha]
MRPDKVQEILHYMWTIRECASRQGGFAGREYDEQFHLRQALHPTSWASINNDLWWRCVQTRAPERQGTPKANNLCHHLNEGHCMWPNCRFTHACSECGSRHPVINCPLRLRPISVAGAPRFQKVRGFHRFRPRPQLRGNNRGTPNRF